MPTITFVRPGENISDGLLTNTGRDQVRSFSDAALRRNDVYEIVITSDARHIMQTRGIIASKMSIKAPPLNIVPSLEPSSVPSEFQMAFIMASQRLRPESSLEDYYECGQCLQALLHHGNKAAKTIRQLVKGHSLESILIIDDAIAVNQLIISFFGDTLPQEMREQVICDQALGHMTGYRFETSDSRWWIPHNVQVVSWDDMFAHSA